MNSHEPSSGNNVFIALDGVTKSNMGPIDFDGTPELFPENRAKGPMSHAFESAQRFRSELWGDE